MPTFISGLDLSRSYYMEAVKPILDVAFAGLRYDAALVGSGSEVLGFDDPRSTDHHWGCRVLLFLSQDDHSRYAEAIKQVLRQRLPHRFRGYPTSMIEIPEEPGTYRFDERDIGLVDHQVLVLTVRQFVHGALEWDIAQPLTAADWLTFPQQRLRAITGGGVWHNGLGELDALRTRLQYFPRAVWLYLLGSGWTRIAQEEPFVGRCGEVGDDLGSRLIAARLVRDLTMLCFLMERVYAPYPKWYGTAFAKLQASAALTPIFQRALSAHNWQSRENALSEAYEIVARMHNALNITAPLPAEVSPFHGRPFMVIHGDRFADAIRAAIEDDAVRRIAERTWIGSIDQYSDSTDFRDNLANREILKGLYG